MVILQLLDFGGTNGASPLQQSLTDKYVLGIIPPTMSRTAGGSSPVIALFLHRLVRMSVFAVS